MPTHKLPQTFPEMIPVGYVDIEQHEWPSSGATTVGDFKNAPCGVHDENCVHFQTVLQPKSRVIK